eukprot:9757750-Prorocentrum_lima.AAC.1
MPGFTEKWPMNIESPTWLKHWLAWVQCRPERMALEVEEEVGLREALVVPAVTEEGGLLEVVENNSFHWLIRREQSEAMQKDCVSPCDGVLYIQVDFKD